MTTARTLLRLVRRSTRESAEVFSGTYKQPRGLRRGVVTLGRCAQEILAERSGDFDKGQSVTVVRSSAGYAIIPGPPRTAGPAASGTLQLGGSPFTSVVQLLPLEPGIRSLSVELGASPYKLHRIFYGNVVGTDAFPTALEYTVDLPTSAGQIILSGTGTGSVLIWGGYNANEGSFFEERAINGLALLGLYEWAVPSTNPFGAYWNMTLPTAYNGRAYWVELDPDDTANTHTWTLRSAALGSIGETTVEASFTEPNSSLAAGTVKSPHLRQVAASANAPGPPWLDAGIWQVDQAVSYWNGSTITSANRTVEFPATEKALVPASNMSFLGGGWRGLVDGNLGPQREVIFPQTSSLFCRFQQDRAFHPQWTAASFNHKVDAQDLIDGVLLHCRDTGLYTTRIYRGPIAEPSPAIETRSVEDASTLVGALVEPRYATWID